MSGRWAEVLSAIAAGLSSVIAFIAILLAVGNERRSREVAKAQIYLALRDRFIGIYERLGDLDSDTTSDISTRLARQAYWHHCFDEWFISNELARREMGDMWDGFYKSAIKAGYDHAALRSTLDELIKDESKGFAEYAQRFISALEISSDSPVQNPHVDS
jgi:hypothetical protein